jgi:hypothetical protein
MVLFALATPLAEVSYAVAKWTGLVGSAMLGVCFGLLIRLFTI